MFSLSDRYLNYCYSLYFSQVKWRFQLMDSKWRFQLMFNHLVSVEVYFWQIIQTIVTLSFASRNLFLCVLHLFIENMSDALSTELWHACAGPLVTLPRKGERVYYFPEGHMEQVGWLLLWISWCWWCIASCLFAKTSFFSWFLFHLSS